MWTVAASAWTVVASMWAVADSVLTVESSIVAAQALCGLFHPLFILRLELCGLLQSVRMLFRRYVGDFILCVGVTSEGR